MIVKLMGSFPLFGLSCICSNFWCWRLCLRKIGRMDWRAKVAVCWCSGKYWAREYTSNGQLCSCHQLAWWLQPGRFLSPSPISVVQRSTLETATGALVYSIAREIRSRSSQHCRRSSSQVGIVMHTWTWD
jgi:hypothetical protein